MPNIPCPDAVPVLDAGSCTLRGWSTDDAREYYDWMRDAEVGRYLGRPLASEAEAMDELRSYIADVRRGAAMRWAVEARDTGQVVGRCHLFRWDATNARASLGYALARSHWAQGITTRVVRAALAWALGGTGVGLHRIEAAAAMNNAASTRVLISAGFTREGVLREYRECAHGYEDFGMYGLLRSEWRNAHGCDATVAARMAGSERPPAETNADPA
jgi:ribosomal-protein-alanine N-acetyltransferase